LWPPRCAASLTLNARLTPDAIEILAHVHMGMAVDTERGLLVPVIRDADQKSLRQFGSGFRLLVERARNSAQCRTI